MKPAPFHSIRWRMQAWHGLLLVIVLAAFGASSFQLARTDRLQQVDRELEGRLRDVFIPDGPGREGPPPRPWTGAPMPPLAPGAGPFGVDMGGMQRRMKETIAGLGTAGGYYYIFWGPDGSVLARSQGAPRDLSPPERPGPPVSQLPGPPGMPGLAGARTRGEAREFYRWMPMDDCLLVGRSIAPEISSLRGVGLKLVAAGCGVLLLGLAGGWWVASRAIRPIRGISDTAVRIAAGDLTRRIDADDPESELGRLAAVLNDTFSRLETAFANQARFTADASHELRTPVAVLLAQTQSALSRERAPAEYREALEACQRAAQRMRRVTESLLALTRLDAGEEPMERKPLDLARVLRESVELIRPVAAQARIAISCDLPGVECAGDAVHLGQVATNLLGNAVQFNREGGEIHVAAWSEQGASCFSVRDTGEGIAAADLPLIFDRFYRVEKSRSRTKGRTGLGLAICKAIVDAHRGSIEVASVPGQGSTFTVKLPSA